MMYGYSQDGLRGEGYSPLERLQSPAVDGPGPGGGPALPGRARQPGRQDGFRLALAAAGVLRGRQRARTSRTLRTVPERHRLVLGLPAVKELPWLKPSAAPPGAETVTDLDRDFIPPGDEVRFRHRPIAAELGQGHLRRRYAEDTDGQAIRIMSYYFVKVPC